MSSSIIGCPWLATRDDQTIKGRGPRDNEASWRVGLSNVRGEEES